MMMMHNDNPTPSMSDTITSQGNATPSINSVASSITMDTLLTTIQDLKKEITTLKGSRNNTINKEINPRTGKPWRRYCWTHGCCTHGSKDCTNKAAGHKDDATFKNRQGGSNKNCLGSG